MHTFATVIFIECRDENNRIVREFLIGANNIDQILKEKTRSAE